MREAFLHYVWQFQYFLKYGLQTSEGEPLIIFDPGSINHDAGPDFQQARVRIDNIDWVGSVEVHVRASEWITHKHYNDPAYDNVILHLVWEEDMTLFRRDGTRMPTLVLKDRVESSRLEHYKKLINSLEDIPCAYHLSDVSQLDKVSMLDRVMVSRLEMKAAEVLETLKKNNNDWDETCYQLITKNFGFKINSESFLYLAQHLPLKLILKHADQVLQVEALLFGQAGFLENPDPTDDYMRQLQREYTLLRKKYALYGRQLNASQWKFLRLRPANFPTVRLAQLAGLLSKHPHLFAEILEASSYAALKALFKTQQSSYWRTHYTFLKEAKEESAEIGDVSIDNIIINTAVPLYAAYSKIKDDGVWMEKALQVLQYIPPENNRITRKWTNLFMPHQNAFDSQALIELYNNFCSRRRCLDCNIGLALLRK
jgi:hypothetical protein